MAFSSTEYISIVASFFLVSLEAIIRVFTLALRQYGPFEMNDKSNLLTPFIHIFSLISRQLSLSSLAATL